MKWTWLAFAGALVIGGAIAVGQWVTGLQEPVTTEMSRAGSGPPASAEPVALGDRGPAPRPVLQVAAADAAVEAATEREWRARWGGIPLDTTGRSLGLDSQRRNKATPFNRALIPLVRADLGSCKQTAGITEARHMDVELFVEATSSGYSIVGAELGGDAGVDVYTKRCIELAFEKHVEVADAGTTAGVLYHLSFPLLMNPPDPPDSGE